MNFTNVVPRVEQILNLLRLCQVKEDQSTHGRQACLNFLEQGVYPYLTVVDAAVIERLRRKLANSGMHTILRRQHELVDLEPRLSSRAVVMFTHSLEQAARELCDVSVRTVHSGRQLLVITHHDGELWVTSN